MFRTFSSNMLENVTFITNLDFNGPAMMNFNIN